jgi:hypothetical protein
LNFAPGTLADGKDAWLWKKVSSTYRRPLVIGTASCSIKDEKISPAGRWPVAIVVALGKKQVPALVVLRIQIDGDANSRNERFSAVLSRC